MRENQYQAQLIRKLRSRFPNAIILKNDSGYLQGIPDLSIFNGDRYAFLEVKVSETSPLQPNQDYYVRLLNDMSYADFIYPENEKAVLRELQQALAPRRLTRLS